MTDDVLTSPRCSDVHTRMTPTRSFAVRVALLAGTLVALAGCDQARPSDDAAPTGCATSMAAASRAVEVDEQVKLLDTALVTCRSYQSFSDEMALYPGIIGYDVATFVTLRCTRVTDELVRDSPTCAAVIAPVTTPPPVTVAELVFVGDTLDGRRIEIRPSADTPFVGDVPAVVQQTVDIAIESGCEGVIAQRDLWAARANDPQYGDEASVYAQHAQNVADYIKCDSSPIETG